jgi:hypothetical protein
MLFSCEPELDLSIIIVNFNVKTLLKKCLKSIFDLQTVLKYEVIVIDNHSEDQSREMVKEDFPKVRLIENQENVGFSSACNQGIRRSRGRYLLFLNPDTEFTSGGIIEMVKFMDKNPNIGICGPQMIGPEGKIQFSARSFPSYLTSISSAQSILNRIFPKNTWSGKYLLKDLDRNKKTEVDWVSGSCLLTKRGVIERNGLLDERFFMYAEDVDYCYRAKRAGYLVYYFPDWVVVHHIGKSTRRRKTRMLAEHHRSMFRFYKKHYPPNLLLTGIVFLGIWIRLWFSLGTSFIHTK